MEVGRVSLRFSVWGLDVGLLYGLNIGLVRVWVSVWGLDPAPDWPGVAAL